jgi:hypothetical protein
VNGRLLGLLYFAFLGWLAAKCELDRKLLDEAHKLYRSMVTEAVMISQELAPERKETGS